MQKPDLFGPDYFAIVRTEYTVIKYKKRHMVCAANFAKVDCIGLTTNVMAGDQVGYECLTYLPSKKEAIEYINNAIAASKCDATRVENASMWAFGSI